MRDMIRKTLRWLDARLLNDGKTFPVFRSSDGSAAAYERDGRGEIALVVSDELAKVPSVRSFHEERFRVTVMLGATAERDERGLTAEFFLVADFLDPFDGRWKTLLMFHESKLAPILNALTDAGRFLVDIDRRV